MTNNTNKPIDNWEEELREKRQLSKLPENKQALIVIMIYIAALTIGVLFDKFLF